MITVIVLDTETSYKKAWHDSNAHVVAIGFQCAMVEKLSDLNSPKTAWKKYTHYCGTDAHKYETAVDQLLSLIQQDRITEPEKNTVVLVGHNINYDLLWLLYRTINFQRALLGLGGKGITLWDTQQAEYLLSGQAHLYPALDDLCKEVGLPMKDDRIKEYWESGVPTENIPKEILLDYLEADVDNTRQLFLMQRSVLVSNFPPLHTLAWMKMRDLLCTTAMEFYGMNFDLVHALSLKKDLTAKIDVVKKEWETFLATNSYPASLSISSAQDVATVLYGGTIEVVVEEPAGEYKSGLKKGQPKYRKVRHVHDVIGQLPKSVVSTFGHEYATPSGKWKMDDEVLTNLKNFWPVTGYVVDMVLEYREAQKDLSTYVEGYSSHVSPETGCIHPNYSHVSTATGRMSCSKPNLQNVTKGE